MDPLYNCTISGMIQVDEIKKTADRYHRVDIQFPLAASKDHIIYPIATAYKVAHLEAPMFAAISAAFLPLAEPKMSIHTISQAMKESEVPEDWIPPSPNITGVGKVTKITDPKTLRISTAVYDRSAGKKRTAEFIGIRDPDRQQPLPTENATIYFTGKLYSQQETSMLFTLTLDDYSWISAATTSGTLPKPPTIDDPTTPTKRPQLGKGKRKQTEDEAGPSQKKASSSSTTSS
ncbi:hypothetical protein CF319_g7502 [Tilletia indica]|nr:hypothetical protein CF319_g7502 [Tilletia indica]